MTHGPRVYAPNEINLSHSGLDKWGQITPIFTGHVYPDTNNEMEVFCKQAHKVLADFRMDVDMLALTGDPALCTLATATLVYLKGSVNARRFTVLKYDRKLGGYYPVHISIGE